MRHRRHVQLDTRVTGAEFDPATKRWTVATDQGDVVQAPFCIMATGCLSTAKLPEVNGLDSFKGKWYHTGFWPHEQVDFTGKRVGVIGTGSSGIQLIPQVAQQASELYVFQRTANYSLPARNTPLVPAAEQAFKQRYAQVREQARESPRSMAIRSSWPAQTWLRRWCKRSTFCASSTSSSAICEPKSRIWSKCFSD